MLDIWNNSKSYIRSRMITLSFVQTWALLPNDKQNNEQNITNYNYWNIMGIMSVTRELQTYLLYGRCRMRICLSIFQVDDKYKITLLKLWWGSFRFRTISIYYFFMIKSIPAPVIYCAYIMEIRLKSRIGLASNWRNT